jgi:hypothetical protein
MRPLSEELLASPQGWSTIIDACQAAKPLNDFLNYTVDEVLGY